MRARSFKPSPPGEGPQRKVNTFGGNNAGYTTSYNEDPGGRSIQWESFGVELLVPHVLGRQRACLRCVDQAVTCDKMTIDFLSEWSDGRRVLHYVKPAGKLFDAATLRQLARWQCYADEHGFILDIVTTRPQGPAARARLPRGATVTILPAGIARDNLVILTRFASPTFCPPALRDFLRDAWAGEGGGTLPLGAVAAALRLPEFEPLHPLYHLVYHGEIVVPSEATVPLGPGSRAHWREV